MPDAPAGSSLIARLRAKLPGAASFQLFGEDLALLGGEDLAAAGAAWQAGVERLSPGLRDRFIAEQAAWHVEAHALLRRYNQSVHHRVAGYVEMGRRLGFAYPWPVVAVLGIEQVAGSLRQSRLYGLFGEAARRLGFAQLAAIIDGSEDVLRRTNRAIFADSIPTVLYALRAHALAKAGETALAEALLDGPSPPLFDEENRALAALLARALARPEPTRFRELAALTLRHFAREQAIFTHQMGARPRRESRLLLRLVKVDSVPAPVIERAGDKRRVVVRPFALPRGFDMRDHEGRVVEFGRAFVSSVTADQDDYRAATAYVLARFGRPGETPP